MINSFLFQKSQLEDRCPKNITYGSFIYTIRFLNVELSFLKKQIGFLWMVNCICLGFNGINKASYS